MTTPRRGVAARPAAAGDHDGALGETAVKGVTRARLLAATRRAWKHDADQRTRRSGPPRPGDVFVIDQPGEIAVEWVILGCDPHDGHRVLAAPADGYAPAGSGDVTVSESAPSGPLVVRCGHAAGGLDAAVFPAAARVGALDPEDVDRARRRWSEIRDGALRPSRRAREVDDDPDYREWLAAVVEPARLDLIGRED